MSKLKAVILSITDVIVCQGELNKSIFTEVIKLIKFLQMNEIIPIVLASKKWLATDDKTGATVTLKDELFKYVRSFPWYCCAEDLTIPSKNGSAKPVTFILTKHNLEPNEVIYIGNSVTDMRTAINSNLLFLNAKWYDSNTNYGFIFQSPKDIAKFIDIFCFREHWWGFSIENKELRIFTLSLYSTFLGKYALTSQDAKLAAKEGRGKLEFWARFILGWQSYYKNL